MTDTAATVLSAERMQVATHWVPAERVRVRREVVSEEVTLTVTVRREVLRVERESLDPDAPQGGDGGAQLPFVTDIDALPGERAQTVAIDLVLREERPVVHLELVPVERVSIGTTRAAGTQTVSADVSREVVEVSRTTAGAGAAPQESALDAESANGPIAPR